MNDEYAGPKKEFSNNQFPLLISTPHTPPTPPPPAASRGAFLFSVFFSKMRRKISVREASRFLKTDVIRPTW